MRTMMDFEFDTKKVQNTHFHQDLEILYVLDGGLEIQIESEKYELGKGDFLLINANKRHSIRETEEELLTASFRINFSMLAEYLGTNQILFWCNTTADKNEAYEQLRKILDRVLNRFYDKEGEGALYLNSIYYEALYVLTSYFRIKADDSRLKDDVTPDNSRVFEIQNYVQANYIDITLDDLAENFFLSKPYLSKYIKEKSGMTFGDLVKKIRMKKAKALLKSSNMTVENIAMSVGYQNVEHFNRLFKKAYDMTPMQFRNQK